MENKDRPAFSTFIESTGHTTGLSKREYFAVLAMQGMLSNPDNTRDTKGAGKDIVKVAIIFADELLKQLENKQL